MDSSIPPLLPFTSYSEWKLKMIAYLKRQGLYEVSIGLGNESYDNENDWINDGDRAFGAICLALSDSLYFLLVLLNTQDLWIKLDKTFSKNNEDHNSTLDITSSTTRVLYSKFLAATLSDQVVQDEDTVANIELRYTNPCNSNYLLDYSNFLSIHAPCMTIVLYYSLFIDIYRASTPIVAPLFHFHA